MKELSFLTLANRMKVLAKGHLNSEQILSSVRRLESASHLSSLQPRNVRLAGEFLKHYYEARRVYIEFGGRGRYDY